MAKVLIYYGTSDGQTGKIARFLGDSLRALGVEVDVADARGPASDARPSAYALVVVAASVHAGGYQKSVRRWVRGRVAELNAKPNVFLSVCLGILQKDPKVMADLEAILEGFRTETGWQPKEVKWVAGALKYTQYNLLKRWVMRRIVAKAGGDLDTSRDYEYTDWNDLRAYAGELHRRISSG